MTLSAATAAPDAPPAVSRGRQMIEAFRAARLSQRAGLPADGAARSAPGPAGGDGPPAAKIGPDGPAPDSATSDAAIREAADGGTAPMVQMPGDLPLAAIGIGAGMALRLNHLGLRTAGDLARADAADLRAALGEISRLIDVEAWIAAARERLDPDAGCNEHLAKETAGVVH